MWEMWKSTPLAGQVVKMKNLSGHSWLLFIDDFSIDNVLLFSRLRFFIASPVASHTSTVVILLNK